MKKHMFHSKTFAGSLLDDQLLAFNGLNMAMVSDSYQSTFLRSQGELVYSDVVVPLFNYPVNIDQQHIVQDMTQTKILSGFDTTQPAFASFSYVIAQKQPIQIVPMPGLILYTNSTHPKLSFAFNDYLSPVAESEQLQRPFHYKMTRMLYTMQILLQLDENLVRDILHQAKKWEKELLQKIAEHHAEAKKEELREIDKRLFYLSTLQDLIAYVLQLKNPSPSQNKAGQLFQAYLNQMPIDDAMNQFLSNHYEQLYAQQSALTVLKLGILS
jgi:hypothetical protein